MLLRDKHMQDLLLHIPALPHSSGRGGTEMQQSAAQVITVHTVWPWIPCSDFYLKLGLAKSYSSVQRHTGDSRTSSHWKMLSSLYKCSAIFRKICAALENVGNNNAPSLFVIGAFCFLLKGASIRVMNVSATSFPPCVVHSDCILRLSLIRCISLIADILATAAEALLSPSARLGAVVVQMTGIRLQHLLKCIPLHTYSMWWAASTRWIDQLSFNNQSCVTYSWRFGAFSEHVHFSFGQIMYPRMALVKCQSV